MSPNRRDHSTLLYLLDIDRTCDFGWILNTLIGLIFARLIFAFSQIFIFFAKINLVKTSKNVSSRILIEWSRPFGLDVLFWGLDPIYNVFS